MADRSVVVRLIADTSGYNDQMRRAGQSTRGLGAAGRETRGVLGELKGVMAGFGAGAIVKTGIEFDSLKERSQAAFTTITGSAKTANGTLDDLYANFKSNPFGYPQILKSSQALLAMGTNAGQLVRTVRDISDASAAVGGTAETLDRFTLAIGQMNAKGTIQAEELRQLAESGIPAWQLLAKEIGVSVPEAMKLVERRQIDSQRGVEALLRGIEKRFGGATDNLKNTWSGTLADFKAQAAAAAGEIVKPLMRIGTDAMHTLQPVLHTAGAIGSTFTGLPTPMQNTALALGAVMLMSNRLNGAWAAGRAGATSYGAAIRNAYNLPVVRANLANFLNSASRVPVQMNAWQRSMALAGMGARRLGGSLLSAFGGPAGLAIIGITLGLSLYQKRQQDAAAAAAAHRAEVDRLSESLDKNTLKLTASGRATQIDTTLTQRGTIKNPLGETNDDWKNLNIVDALDKMHISANLARRALDGDRAALDQLNSALLKHGDLGIGVFREVNNAANALGESVMTSAQQMKLRIPEAAETLGVSAKSVTRAFEIWRDKGGELKDRLRETGYTAREASAIYNLLSGSAQGAGGSLAIMADKAKELRTALSSSAGEFVNLTGAWDAAASAKSVTGSTSGDGGRSKAPKLSDDPAYRAAKKAADEQYRQLQRLKQADQDHLRDVRAAAKADAEAASAATKRASAIKKTADEAHRASLKALDAVKNARDAKAAADRNAHDAAALSAAVQDQMRRAGTSDQAAWQHAAALATGGQRRASVDQRHATGVLSDALTDADTKHQVSLAARTAAQRAATEAREAQRRAARARNLADSTARAIERIEARAERRHEQLLEKTRKAEEAAQKRIESYNSAVSSSYAGAAESVTVTLEDYLTELRKQVKAQQKWKDDLLSLAAKVPPGMAAELGKLGPQAAPLIAKLSTASKPKLDEFVALFGKAGTDSAKKMADTLTEGIPLIEEVGRRLGSKAAAKLAAALASGKTTVSKAMTALQGTFDKQTLKVKLGIRNKTELARQLDAVIKNRVYKITPWKGPGGQTGFQVGTVRGLATGGWVRGGSGKRDDVPVPFDRGRGGLLAMGGEFMVKQSIAQRHKPFFDEMDRTGRMPAAAPASSAPVIVMPSQAPARQVINYITVVQQPGQSLRGLALEIDRHADIGMGR